MDGSDGRTDLRLSHPDSIGVYHRSSTKPDGTALLIGSQPLTQQLIPQGLQCLSAKNVEASAPNDGMYGFRLYVETLVNRRCLLSKGRREEGYTLAGPIPIPFPLVSL